MLRVVSTTLHLLIFWIYTAFYICFVASGLLC
jgi:hypothetical protein